MKNLLKKNLKIALEKAETSLKELENQTGIKSQRINDYLMNDGELNVSEYEALAEALGLNLEYMPANTFGNIQSGKDNRYVQIVIMDKTNPAMIEMINSLLTKN